MNNKTHKVGGLCSGLIVSTIMFSKNPELGNLISSGLIISGATIGSLAPDIDHPESKVGRKFLLRPISILISKLFGHRTITHSVVMSVFMTILLLISTTMFTGIPKFIYSNLIIGFCVGWMSHLLLDLITVKGIPIYYPFIKRKYSLLKFKTSRDEELVTMLIILLTGTLIALYFILNK